MAALSRPDTANYEIHEHVKVDTTGESAIDFRGVNRFFFIANEFGSAVPDPLAPFMTQIGSCFSFLFALSLS